MKRLVTESNCLRLFGVLAISCGIVTIIMFSWFIFVDLTGLGAGIHYVPGSSVRYIVDRLGGTILGGIFFPGICVITVGVAIVSGILLLIPVRFTAYSAIISLSSILVLEGGTFIDLLSVHNDRFAKDWIVFLFVMCGLSAGTVLFSMLLWLGAKRLRELGDEEVASEDNSV